MNDKHQKILTELVDTCGVSGYSEDIVHIFLREASKYGLECGCDSLGSVSAYLENKPQTIHNRSPKSIMISAHLDTVGYLVSRVLKDNELSLVKIGSPGLNDQHAGVVKTQSGVFGLTIYDREDEEYYAIGILNNDTDLEHIRLGDPVYYDHKLLNKPKGKFTGACMDNKASILVLLMAIEKLIKCKNLEYNLFFVLTAMEEIGAYGVQAAVSKIKPTFAINLDVFPVDSKKELSLGVVISRGCVYNQVLTDYVVNEAKENSIPHEIRVPSAYDESDANYILPMNGGTPCCEIGIPVINIHLPNEVVSKKGIDSTAILLVAACTNATKIHSLIPGGNHGM